MNNTSFKKGHVSWNKGIPWSDSVKKKMSVTRIGKVPSEKWTKSMKSVWNDKNVHLKIAKKHADNPKFKDRQMEKNPNWKGGISDKGNGYKYTLGQFDHIRIWRSYNNWLQIPKGFIIHHRNRNKLDNRIENLMLLPRDIHCLVHQLYNTGFVNKQTGEIKIG